VALDLAGPHEQVWGDPLKGLDAAHLIEADRSNTLLCCNRRRSVNGIDVGTLRREQTTLMFAVSSSRQQISFAC
jgi:hypothetical protein